MDENKNIEMVMVEDNCDYEESGDERSGGLLSTVGKVVLGGVAVGVTAVAVKKRDKIAQKMTDHKIKKLEKKGYIVKSPEARYDIIDSEVVDETEE